MHTHDRRVVAGRRLLALIATLASFACLVASQVSAQTAPSLTSPVSRPLAITQSPVARAAPGTGGMFDGIWLGLMQAQRDLTQAMTGAVRRLKTGDPIASTAFLGFISFLYGVLHAVGPGHGKFVISSYALANRQTMRRGIALSFMAALVQALSAIALVAVVTAVLKAGSIQMRATEAWLETLSWALIAGVGGWLLWRQASPLLVGWRRAATQQRHRLSSHHGRLDTCDHDHRHDDHGHGNHEHEHAETSHVHDAPHGHDEQCGHVHVPEPSALAGPWSWRDAWMLALSIGIRPCTGAILVLIFASSIGLFWAGVFAAFAMAIGTALTIALLVAMAVGSRDLAARWAGGDAIWAGRLERTVGLVGAVLVLAIGLAGFVGSLTAATPL